MTKVYIVWYINPELNGNRYAIWGVYDSEEKALATCALIDKEFHYDYMYSIKEVN